MEILGLNGVPQAGDSFTVVSSESQSREIAEKRRLISREEALAHRQHVSLQLLKRQVDQKLVKELRIVLKTDVQGSLEALRDSLEKLSTPEIQLRTLHSGVGNVNESDVLLAEASNAVILGFHVEAESRAKEEAERTGVEIRQYSIIYEALADVKAAMEGLLEPELVEVSIGRLEVRRVFQIPKAGKIAGCFVANGKIQRGALVKVLRSQKSIFEGRITGLKRFKDDAREVDKGLECGVSVEGFQDFQPGDILEIMIREKRMRRLSAETA